MGEKKYLKVAFVKYTEKARKAYMFEHGDSLLSNGDTVIVMNSDGDEVEATVMDTQSYDLTSKFDKEELNRLLLVAGAEMPFRKIKGKVYREYYKYEDEVSADENDNK